MAEEKKTCNARIGLNTNIHAVIIENHSNIG